MKAKAATFFLTLGLLTLSPLSSTAQSVPTFVYPNIPGINLNTLGNNDAGFNVDGNLWIATSLYGCAVFDHNAGSWSMLNISGGLPTDSVICISFGNGSAWIGTRAGAVRYQGAPGSGGSVQNVYTMPQLPDSVVNDIFVESQYVWFGTSNGLARLDNNTGAWQTFTLPGNHITKIIRDLSGTLWVGTRQGLFSSNDHGVSWTTFTASGTNDLIGNNIFDLEFDSSGRVWISSGNLVTVTTQIVWISYYHNGQFYKFNLSDYGKECLNGEVLGNKLNFTKTIDGDVTFSFNTSTTLNDLITATPCAMEIIDGIFPNPCIFTNAPGRFVLIDPNGNLAVLSRSRQCFYSYPVNSLTYDINTFICYLFSQLDINDVRAGLLAGGDMHWNLSDPKYEVPKGSGKHTVYASAHWIGGLDHGGQVRVAAQTYRQTGLDFWPGPIDGISIPMDSASSMFNRIFKVSRWEVESFKNHFQNGTLVYQPPCNNNVPQSILDWPAKGNGIVTGNLAPFIDVDGNGVYNPLTGGDYPDILGDQTLFKVYNDSLDVHTETGSQPLGLEFRTFAYAYSCDTALTVNKVLNQTTFYKTQIINKSSRDYSDVYFGHWVDVDLGYYIDDYVGCDVGRNTGFAYNGDPNDETPSGYGLNPPIMNVKVLRGPTAPPGDGRDNNNNGVVDESGEYFGMNSFLMYMGGQTPTGNPFLYPEFYYYLQGIWRDGQQLTYGDDGRNPNAPVCDFMFPGTTDPVHYPTQGDWSEFTAGFTPSDRRFVMSSGPFPLNAGDTVVFDYAYIFSRDSLSGGNLNFALNNSNLDLVQSWFDNNNFPGCTVYSVGVTEDSRDEKELLVYPNPAHDAFTVLLGEHLASQPVTIRILDLTGRVITEKKSSHQPEIIFSTNHLDPGLYLITVQGKDQSVQQVRISVIR